MKKWFFLFALLGLIALPMFASDFTFGGDFEYGVISDLDGNEADTSTLNLDIKATVDDYNSLSVEFDLEDKVLDKAVLTTDIGSFLELPIGLKLDWGSVDPDCNEFNGFIGYYTDEPWDLSQGDYWGFNLLATIDMVEIELAMDPGQYVVGEVDDDGNPLEENAGKLLAGIVFREPIPGLNAELFYYQNGSALGDGSDVALDVMDEGLIVCSVGYGMDVNDDLSLNVGAGLGYLLAEVEDEEINMEYAFGLKTVYSMATLIVGLNGDNVDPLNEVAATIEVAPIDLITLYSGIELKMSEAASEEDETFQGADMGMYFTFGKTKIYVGYLVTDALVTNDGDGKGGLYAPSEPGTGGAYIKCDIDY
jgi:hypothetical protein